MVSVIGSGVLLVRNKLMEKINIAISGIGNRSLPKDPSNSNWLGWAHMIKQSQGPLCAQEQKSL